MALEVTDVNIEDVLTKNEVTVLQFSAEWCGPCRTLGPIVDSLSLDEKNKDVTIGKINVDENNASAGKYGVRSIPTIIFLKGGVVIDKVIGVNTKEALQEKIDSLKS
jgi:thioredoxin 1